MGIRVIHVLTHDSIGLGEDGPTHQPVEQIAALRAIPNLLVFRPADADETAECWQMAIESDEPSVGPGADPPEPVGGPHRIHGREPVGQGRLYARRRRRRQGHDLRHRLGSRDRRCSRQAAGRQGHCRPRRLRAVHRSSSSSSPKPTQASHRQSPRSRSPSKPASAQGWDALHRPRGRDSSA